MKKKGFTLVELLAVIAILAILVIIALPNVMNLFNRAKQNAFETELKEVFKTAQQQWIADSMFNTQEREYANCKTGCPNKLDMSGRSELEYYIKLDKSGNVVSYKATDGSYQYSYSGTGLKIEDIGDAAQISKIEDESQIINVSCEGDGGGSGNTSVVTKYYYSAKFISFKMNELITEYNRGTFDKIYDYCVGNTTLYYDAFNNPYFLKLKTENDIIKEIYIVYLKNDTEYALKGADSGESYEQNKTVLNSLFGSNKCSESVSSGKYNYHCFKNDFGANAYSDGNVSFSYEFSDCNISLTGGSCYYSDTPTADELL